MLPNEINSTLLGEQPTVQNSKGEKARVTGFTASELCVKIGLNSPEWQPCSHWERIPSLPKKS
ncbi:MAG TPA: hypothetical protein VGH19_06780 [Verrucomicrobiae bacterium]